MFMDNIGQMYVEVYCRNYVYYLTCIFENKILKANILKLLFLLCFVFPAGSEIVFTVLIPRKIRNESEKIASI